MLNIQTAKILEQEMDRKVFLKTTGFALIGLIGVTAAVKRLNVFGNALGPALTAQPAAGKRTAGVSLAYGNSAYGV